MSGKSNASRQRSIAYTRPVTPSNTVDLPGGVTRALLVNQPGAVAVVYRDGTEDSLFLLEGVFHPVEVVRVKLTGTTATGIKAGY